MDSQQAAEQLRVIRECMERPVRYSTQSGLAGILAGVAALAGTALDVFNVFYAKTDEQWLANAMFIWAGVFLVALGGVLVLTRIREKRQGMPAWSPIKARILRTILPPFVAGVGLSLTTLYYWHLSGRTDQGYLIPAIWMLFYGLAVWQIGEFSVVEIRCLGAAFIVAGVVTALFFQAWPYEALGITFGGFHIVYGTIVWARHGG